MEKGLCKHYNSSFHNKTCLAGVCYDDVTPDPKKPGCALRRPCRSIPLFTEPHQLAEFNRRGTCEKYEEPTQEEIAAHEAKITQMVSNFTRTLPLMARIKKEHKGENWQGVEECPVCKNKLQMTHAAYNGHTRGKCETPDCLSWIE